MTRYIIRRILWGILLLILVTALMFVLFRILPTGDPARLRAGRNASPKVIADIRHDLGLDKSLPAQFWIYMKDVFLHFNLGYSYYSNAPVRGLIAERLRRDALADARGGGHLAGGRPAGRDRLGAAPALVARPREHGHRARVRLGAGILARADRAVPVRRRHRPGEDLPRRRQLRLA